MTASCPERVISCSVCSSLPSASASRPTGVPSPTRARVDMMPFMFRWSCALKNTRTCVLPLVSEGGGQIARGCQRVAMLRPESSACTPCTSRCTCSASAYFCWGQKGRRPDCLQLPTCSDALSRAPAAAPHVPTSDHQASASPADMPPVKTCRHVWHSHHILRPLFSSSTLAARARLPTCASPEAPRHAQPDCMGGGLASSQMNVTHVSLSTRRRVRHAALPLHAAL